MIKCVVWDLDNTIWQGVLSENDKPEMYADKIKLIKKLDEVGILQSIASRNDNEAAKKELDKQNVLHYFLFPQIGFTSKAVSIKKIARALNISLSAIAFIDDSAFERQEVSYLLPDVKVYDSVNQWDSFINDLEIPDTPTFESRKRREFFIAKAARVKSEKSSGLNREEFLISCNMKLIIRTAKSIDIPRICELAKRTNQFKTFSSKVDETLCLEYISNPKKEIFISSLSDKFGQYGVVGICFVAKEADKIIIEMFCLSCKVESRGIGIAFINSLVNKISVQSKTACVQCRFKQTDMNKPMLILLKTFGFKRLLESSEDTVYEIQSNQLKNNCRWIDVRFE